MSKSEFEKARDEAPWVSLKIKFKLGMKRTLIDREDQDLIKNWNLRIKESRGKFYVDCHKLGTRQHKMLHRLIMGDNSNYHVDHINGDTLDNRKSNLRYVNHSMNMRNQKGKDSKMPRYIFKDKDKDHYTVIFRKRDNGKRIKLCNERFGCLIEAVKFRDNWIIENDWFGFREMYIKQLDQQVKIIAEYEKALDILYTKNNRCTLPNPYMNKVINNARAKVKEIESNYQDDQENKSSQ